MLHFLVVKYYILILSNIFLLPGIYMQLISISCKCMILCLKTALLQYIFSYTYVVFYTLLINVSNFIFTKNEKSIIKNIYCSLINKSMDKSFIFIKQAFFFTICEKKYFSKISWKVWGKINFLYVGYNVF